MHGYLISVFPHYLASLLCYSEISKKEEPRFSRRERQNERHYLPELFLAREEAAEEEAVAMPMLGEVIRPLLGALGCRGGGDPFVGVELSDERPESSRPSSAPPPVPFSRLTGTTRMRVGRPVARLRAPFEFSVDEEAILARSLQPDRRLPSDNRARVIGRTFNVESLGKDEDADIRGYPSFSELSKLARE